MVGVETDPLGHAVFGSCKNRDAAVKGVGIDDSVGGVGEEQDGCSFDRFDLQIGSGKDGFSSVIRSGKVDQDCGGSLARLSNVLFHSFDLFVEVIVVRLVFLSDFITEQVEALSVLDGQSSPLGDSLLDLSQKRVLFEESSVAGTGLALGFLSRRSSDLRSGQSLFSSDGNDLIGLFVTDKVLVGVHSRFHAECLDSREIDVVGARLFVTFEAVPGSNRLDGLV